MLSGKCADTLWASGVFYSGQIQDYQPGKIGDNGGESAQIFTVNRTDEPFSTSWQNWAIAVEYGAPFYDGNSDGVYNEGIDVALDTAVVMNGILGERIFPGAKNLKLSSSSYMSREISFRPPQTKGQARAYLLGGMNSSYDEINPCDFPYGNTPENCEEINNKFIFSGDPVAGEGWLNTFSSDKYLVEAFGPFTLNANETKTIYIAFTAAQGEDNLSSVTAGRLSGEYLKTLYDNNFRDLITGVSDEGLPVSDFKLYQNYPNPFNPTTEIAYALPTTANVTLKIYNSLGQEVAPLVNNHRQDAGNYKVTFNASKLSSGIYFYTIRANDFTSTRKMILLK
jgi:hypothetical protein